MNSSARRAKPAKLVDGIILKLDPNPDRGFQVSNQKIPALTILSCCTCTVQDKTEPPPVRILLLFYCSNRWNQ
jgi:hypothetical protein